MAFRDNARPDVVTCVRCGLTLERSSVTLSGEGEPMCPTCTGHTLVHASEERGRIAETKKYAAAFLLLYVPVALAGLGVLAGMALIVYIVRC
jgi:hypothetical protein